MSESRAIREAHIRQIYARVAAAWADLREASLLASRAGIEVAVRIQGQIDAAADAAETADHAVRGVLRAVEGWRRGDD